jgi:hypothetical protein
MGIDGEEVTGMARIPLRWSLSRLTEEASNLTWYIYGFCKTDSAGNVIFRRELL